MKRKPFWLALGMIFVLAMGGCGKTAAPAASDTAPAAVSEAEVKAEGEETPVAGEEEKVEAESRESEMAESEAAVSGSEETKHASSEAETEAEEPEAQAAAAASLAPKSTIASTDVLAMDRNVLTSAYRFFHEMDSDVMRNYVDLSFAESVVGIPGVLDRTSDNGDEYYRWSESDTVYLELAFREREDESRTMANILLYNIGSEEWDTVNMYDYLEMPAGRKEVTVAQDSVTFTMQAPEDWFYYSDPFGDYLVWSYTEELAEKGSCKIGFESGETQEDIDKKLDRYENLVELEGRTIGGCELSGRTYEYVGYPTIEYYGQTAEGKYVSIKIFKMSLLAGGPQDEILNSIQFS
ncbi:MAG: hypothetical protein Q4B22_07570 [Eubacteriales bacterium]|nr:hypothetical protein [Eubacteriales bacterium]